MKWSVWVQMPTYTNKAYKVARKVKKQLAKDIGTEIDEDSESDFTNLYIYGSSEEETKALKRRAIESLATSGCVVVDHDELTPQEIRARFKSFHDNNYAYEIVSVEVQFWPDTYNEAIQNGWSEEDAMDYLFKKNEVAIFKLLPKTNCGECGAPRCLEYAVALAADGAALSQCQHLSIEAREAIYTITISPKMPNTVMTF